MVAAQRILEDASDAIARLDLAASVAPRAFASALWFSAVSALADAGPKGTRSLLAVFAGSDSVLDHAGEDLEAWRSFLEIEERRARSGAPLTASRLLRAPRTPGMQSTTRADEVEATPDSRGAVHAAVEDALQWNTSTGRPAALDRATAVAAAIPDRATSEAAAALVLVAEGRTDRTRLLPFSGVDRQVREQAARQARAGDAEQWRTLALDALIQASRRKTQSLARATEALASEDAALDALGRAAITARQR